MAFSDDGKLLLAQGGAPDWSLSMWAWERSKLLANVRTATQPGHTAVQCLFQPGTEHAVGRRVGRDGVGCSCNWKG